jgi:hypothetical protein
MPDNPGAGGIGKDISFNINPAAGQFGISGSHTPYTPSAQNTVGNQGQWWTQLAEQDAAKKQAAIAQQLSNPAPPPVRGFHDYLNTLGAKNVNLGWGKDQMGYFSDTVAGHDQRIYKDSQGARRANTGIYPGFGPRYNFGDKTRQGGYYPGQSAYIDRNDGFLGYAEKDNYDQLFDSSPRLQRNYYEQLFASGQPPPSNGEQF